jgi:hypothetical protein
MHNINFISYFIGNTSQEVNGCLLPMSIISTALFITIIASIVTINILCISIQRKAKTINKMIVQATPSESAYEEIGLNQSPKLSTSDNVAYSHANIN